MRVHVAIGDFSLVYFGIMLSVTGLIRQVVKHHAQLIYTRTTKSEDQA